MSRSALVIWASFHMACSSKAEPTPAPVTVAPRDAAIPDGITTIGHFDPASGMHLDDDGPSPMKPRQARQPGKVVDITLRSSPPNAIAAVDGQQIGRTPTYAPVTSGVEHEFTFVLDGYAFARYRFVPVQGGVVHATMEPMTTELDAGVALPPEMSRAPTQQVATTPDAAVPVPMAPPPDAAAPTPDATISIDAAGRGPIPF